MPLLPKTSVITLVETVANLRERGARVYVCGNGGSCANAAHLVLHLREVGIKAHDLMADAPWLSAIANDHAYEQAFYRSLQALGAGPEDLLIVISGSGKSKNILCALEFGTANNIPCTGLLGRVDGGGPAKDYCLNSVIVDSNDYGVIEDVHSIIIHALKKALTV